MSSIIDGINYGPLALLLGRWIGNKGLDNAPDANANADKTGFTDEINFTISGHAENAEEQKLVFGHWIYEHDTNIIMHSLSIPRAVCLLAGGKYEEKNGLVWCSHHLCLKKLKRLRFAWHYQLKKIRFHIVK